LSVSFDFICLILLGRIYWVGFTKSGKRRESTFLFLLSRVFSLLIILYV